MKKYCDIQYLIKFLITLLFIVIICSSICFLIKNVCILKDKNTDLTFNSQNIELIKDSLVFKTFNPKVDSSLFKKIITFNRNDIIFALLAKDGYNNAKLLQNNSSSIDSSKDDLIKIITILISVFTAIFGIFTFLTQNNLNRAEKIKDDFDKQRENIKEDNKELETKIQEKETKFQELTDLFQQRTENLLKNATELLSRNNEENKRNKDLWFLVANQFLSVDIQPSIANLKDIIDLWDTERAKFAAYNLLARGDKKCILFLEDRYNYYSSKSELEMKYISNCINDAITEIKKREKIV